MLTSDSFVFPRLATNKRELLLIPKKKRELWIAFEVTMKYVHCEWKQ